jgi:protein-S-isoprenylcysteine O-methyltransferase Ste14
MSEEPRYEFMAIPVVLGIIGVVALVLFAATEGPWVWIMLGVGLLIVLALVVRLVAKKYPHIWDEAPADETVSQNRNDSSST